MKKWYLLFLPLVLIGAGCASDSTVTNEVPALDSDVEEMIVVDRIEDVDMMDEGEESMMEEEEDDGTMMEVGEARTFNITGENFAFSTKEMRVKEGDTVTIHFTSESGFHNWVVDEFDAATTQVNTGGSSSVTFVADQAGEFEYYCGVGNHRAMGMVGKLIVE